MASGGARSRSGPPPDPTALRRDRKGDAAWTTLPKEGRTGDPPAWPLTEASPREREWWVRLWATPQATQWEPLGQHIEVALYVRRLTEAEMVGATSASGTLVRQMADALGLTIPGLRVNRWRIGSAVAAAEKTSPASARTSSRPSARDRFTVINGTAAG